MVDRKNIDPVEAWYERRCLTLDMVGFTEDERVEGSALLGGTGARFVASDEVFNLSEVASVVFEWGDQKAEDVFAALLEHDDAPGEMFFPFTPTAVIGDMLWMLTLQDRDFSPERNFQYPDQYFVLPFERGVGETLLIEYLARPTPRPELIAKIGTRWVAFSAGTNFR